MALQESKLRMTLGQRESQMKEFLEKAQTALKEKEAKIEDEKEKWLTALKSKEEDYQSIKNELKQREVSLQKST